MTEFDPNTPDPFDPEAPNTPPDPFAPLDLVSDMTPPAAPAAAPGQRRASSLQLSILYIVATIILASDQLTKRWIEANLSLYESMPVLNLAPYFQFTHTTNTGAAFGLFQSAGNFFGIIAVVVGIAIVIYNFQLPAGHRLLRLALGMQLGGAFGNLVDRLRQGHVTDFLNADFSSVVNIPFADVPVFNIADAAIVCGTIALALVMIFEKEETATETEMELDEEDEVAYVATLKGLPPLVNEPDDSF